ncbi:hypothetical protein CASFOL_036968 [Castilleja foliolosa]|uniref:Protein transport protein sec16 n=1 Tax=Castilleja foliolosa TaxID=1961234 RepID=A0ABD3BQA1_9LAMI
MASNPPFQVEDSTDEDFFDKLVDDDLDFKVTTASSASVGTFPSDQNEFDEAKAFANLSIDELGNSVDDVSTAIRKLQPIIKSEHVEDSENTVGMPLNPTELNKVIEQPENEDAGGETLSDRTVISKSSGESFSDTNVVSKSSGESGGPPGVKEVGWSAFHADSAGNDGSGFGSYSDFFSELGGDNNVVGDALNNGVHVSIGNEHVSAFTENSNNTGQYNTDQGSDVQDLSSSEYWENQYPGWKYDSSSGQWYQVDGFNGGLQENVDSSLSIGLGTGNEQQAEVSYLQQPTAQSVDVAVPEIGKTENVINWNQASPASDTTENTTDWNQVSQVSSYWNQGSQDNNGYPAHMVFDPQYPGWYYDTIAQKWESLESYTASVPSTAQVQDQSRGGYALNDQKSYNIHGQVSNHNDQGFGSKAQNQKWAGPVSNYGPQSSSLSQYQPMEDHHGHNFSVSGHVNRQDTFKPGVAAPYYENASQSQNDFPVPSSSQGFVGGSFSQQQFNDSTTNRNDHKYVSNNFYSNQNSGGFSQQQFQSSQMSYAPAAGRSSAGRPAHALVTFGFGGKLILLKENSCTESFNVGSQNPAGGSISVLSLAEVLNHNPDASSHGMGVRNHFQALFRQCVPGPLSGGSVGSKELNKWIDERIANPESADTDYGKAEVLRLLLSLLKIACQYYGKLRSPYGTDAVLKNMALSSLRRSNLCIVKNKENDPPESAVARLFACAKTNSSHFSQHGVVAQCLQQMPPEGQMRVENGVQRYVTAAEVQSLLVSGRKREALECAQEGQMWGPALVLAAQLGDQFYVETIKKMALSQFVVGSPLRTLCLLIAGQPAEVFSASSTAIGSMGDSVNMHQQGTQFGANGMLDSWEENLAVITANRTKDDELVLMHLGDCLWKDRSDINAAHICYLVAEENFEPYSDTARMCLVGADHWKFPRTYASPEAIQRTEVYEYSKTLGNSQFVLLPFQPYKLVYAQMLAEVGKMSDALKYCQAVLKCLKTGRAPEVETLRNLVSSFEERIKAHQQGGFSTNLAPKRLVGKLLNLFDNTAHRVVGGIPPPIPTSGGAAQGNENFQQLGPRVSTSQSTMAMSSLMPSQSTGPTNEWGAADSNRMSMHTRSISEPDFGRSPMQGHAESSKEASASSAQEKASTGGGMSRFGRFGFGSQLFQKTVGLVLKPRQDRQAKLGDTNKFYYDEKLKRWVEEGAEPPAQEAALPPPPPTSVFQNGTSDYNLKSAMQSQPSYNNGNPEYKSPSVVDNNSGIPPLPPTTSNQYSARGRMGVRSRYVDTFNKGGGTPTSSFQSPSIPSPVKPTDGPKRNFFVPAPISAAEQQQQATNDAYVDNTQENTFAFENHLSSSSLTDSFQPMQKFASSNNISVQGIDNNNNNGSFPAHSRRALSWSGNLNGPFSAQHRPDLKPLEEVMGMHPSPSDPSLVRSGDDLHEVEL